MHLSRIRIPEYRVLKDIDISFEKDFKPAIFPLGSQNGGGKSTLLQLIFVLLHCSFSSDKVSFLKNMLEGFKINENDEKRVLAIINIWDGEKDIELEFFSRRALHLEEWLKERDEVENLICITDYSSEENEEKKKAILCKIKGLDINESKVFLEKLSQKVFLAAPYTQIFLFLPKEDRHLLFKAEDKEDAYSKILPKEDYYSELKFAKSTLHGFFTYDFFPVDLLIKYFEKVRDDDFKYALKTGSYGDNYQKLLNNFNSILSNKKVNLSEDFSSVIFKNEEGIELNPEDLSHGELKRLSIYMWIKFNQIEDAIVLMDEIEIALHPDWQYQIINDLIEWTPTNQYILATHSYELCQAVTPAHVKEIEPKLFKDKAA
jgi:predicted ATP-dependent endonuclease of OLD family